MRLRRHVEEVNNNRVLPEMLINTLNQLENDALVLAPGELPILPLLELSSSEY